MILDPVPDEMPDPDCSSCGGEGKPTEAQRILAEDWAYPACPDCWKEEPR